MAAAERRAFVLAAVVGLVGACHKSAAPRSAMDAAPSGDLAGLEAQLSQNAAQLRTLGVAVPDAKAREFEAAKKAEPSQIATKHSEEKPADPEPDLDAPRLRPEPESPDSGTPPAQDPIASATRADPCSRICALAGVACDLSLRICTLAEQHEGEARYEDLCWNARSQCDEASDACSDCSSC